MTVADVDEAGLVERLRAGDESAFAALVDAHHDALVRVAQGHVSSRAVAEEVAQETWLGVLQGVGRFEGRSSLKTWLFQILVNRAKTRGQREARTVPFSALGPEPSESEPAVDPSRFLEGGHRWGGFWATPPKRWDGVPDERLLSKETMSQVGAALGTLPPRQREVIVLRDVEELTSEEVCDLLGLSVGNQRVLLHRARSSVRSRLEEYLDA
ncbi:MAG: sigma-70 family RNA polymerase sigma factor [Actinomycetota bacterium]|nr:sigma-70 family RNA polymerase sigma factor [Acidimicrobiia bacterium]MDQ3146497.1 sigma-70 family RNA polymerase sigma factor [Actinomycetota bacterium]